MAVTTDDLHQAGEVLAAAATVRAAAATWRASHPALPAVVVDALDMRDETPALRCGRRSIYLANSDGHCWAVTRQMDKATALILTQDDALTTRKPMNHQDLIQEIAASLATGAVIPYLGPEMLSLCNDVCVPATPLALAEFMTAKVSVPHKIRKRLTQAAQFIENFKHRKSVVHLMNEAFATTPAPSPLHLALAASGTRLWVDTWYDDTFAHALAQGERPWAQVQGLSQSEHFGQWTGAYAADGTPLAELADEPGRLLYKPLGSHSPAGNYLVSDSDYVEVLTEIDIQAPIPTVVQNCRTGRHFLFLGCRFDDQLTRSFARQIMKRSSHRHWAVLPGEPTRMEARFLAEQNITRIDLTLAQFATRLIPAMQPLTTA